MRKISRITQSEISRHKKESYKVPDTNITTSLLEEERQLEEEVKKRKQLVDEFKQLDISM